MLSARYRHLREYIGRLSRFYLDGLLGLVAIRTHGAERSVAYEHQGLLIQWARKKLALHRLELIFASIKISVYWLALALLVLSYLARGQQITILLLLLYWAFRLVYIIEELVPTYLEYFSQESKAQRFLEPLKAPDEEVKGERVRGRAGERASRQGVKIELKDVTVEIASTLVLSNVNLTIERGEHLAIVGSSGAGKSTLVGALLGWHQVTGQILIDGREFKESLLALRRETAWLDPAIQLWNQSILKNLTYGTAKTPLSTVIEQADLMNILERLPDGLNTRLGEGGRLVSGGQGQRVRFGRALGRKDARFVILDEPFRGLDREKREKLLARARQFFKGATLICVTHDISSTNSFDRVLVVHAGKIVEADAPSKLMAKQGSRYQALLKAEQAVREGLFSSTTWQRLWLEGGQLSLPPEPAPETKESAKAARISYPAAAKAAHAHDQSTQSSNNALPTWSLADLDEAIPLLALKSGLPAKRGERRPSFGGERRPSFGGQAAEAWIESIITQRELTSQEVTYSYEEVEDILKKGAPALLRLPNERFIALLRGRKGWPYLSIIGPAGKVHQINRELIRNALCYPLEAPLEAQIESTLTQVEWPEEQRKKAHRALLDSTLKGSQIGRGWLLAISPKATLRDHIRVAKLPTYLWQILTMRLLNRLLVFGSWGVMGYMVFLAHVEYALLLAWLLLVFSIIPTIVLRMWSEKLFAITAGIVLRQRLFSGTLNLSSDDIQTKGAGQFLGWVIDSEAIEEAILIETPGTIRALVELLIALLLLFSSIPLAAFSLLGWLAFTGGMSWRFLQHERRWKAHYTDMTNELVEKMIGHQTRLVQEKQRLWHEDEDRVLAHYESLSKKRDQFEAWLVAFTPYGWLVLGLVAISYQFISQPEAVTLAISTLAILTAFQALKDLSLKLRGLVRAVTSYQQIKPILQATKRTTDQKPTQSLPLKKKKVAGKVILDGRQLTFRYQPHHKPILQKCHLRIAEGDRLLLEGPSGGGKSTLAALLAGLRQPNSGMLLLHGLDWHTIGSESWHQRIVYAPQFHENHILSGTLAFNLLMGRRWPASAEDLADAEAICRDLALGILLDKMPLGLQQPVGETGWHLSHGERSRIYIARALLQQADLVILDESFGALDPQNMEIALRTVLKRAPTLLVIAHP
jgi:ATP-binding cassette subfamily B protein